MTQPLQGKSIALCVPLWSEENDKVFMHAIVPAIIEKEALSKFSRKWVWPGFQQVQRVQDADKKNAC